ncbi:MAG: D-alanine--D-alanine ligase family protein [Acidimicrobiales bacterium]
MSEVAVIFGGPSPEHDVSVLTGLQAARALAGRDVVHALYWSKTGDWYEVDAGAEASAFVDGVPRAATPLRLALGAEGGFLADGGRFGRSKPLALDAAVVCCHGGPGEDGSLQAALDLAGIVYTGPTVAGAAIGMDKLAFAAVAGQAGLPTLPRVLLEPDGPPLGFEGPYIVKPRFGGSSIGIEIVADLTTARARLDANPHLRAGAVAEPYRPTFFDLQVGVRSWPELALSAVERPLRTPRAGGAAGEPEILGYADKYVGGEGMASAPRQLPAEIDAGLEKALRGAALAVARLVSLRGVARIDFLSDGTDLVVNEVNTVPGSLARYLWTEPAVPFRTLLDDLLAEARTRPTHSYRSAGADGTVLRGAASIAAKLA